jgi:hypothetical protein
LDFIFRLLQIEPRRRMSVTDALSHSWLADPSISPVIAPKEFLPDYMIGDADRQPLEVVDGYDPGQSAEVSQNMSAEGPNPGNLSPNSVSGKPYPAANELPTWHAANNNAYGSIYGGVSYGAGSSPYGDGVLPMRVRSPPRSPRSPRTSGGPQRIAFDRLPFDRFGMDDRSRGRYPAPARLAQVIATTHSPAPNLSRGFPERGSPPPRTGSPLQRELSPNHKPNLGSSTGYAVGAQTLSQAVRPAMLTPRSNSGRSPNASPLTSAVPPMTVQAGEGDERTRGRAWAFRSESPGGSNTHDANSAVPGRARAPSPFGSQFATVMRPNSLQQVPYAPSRSSPQRLGQGPSTGLGQGTSITFPRALSPGLIEASAPTRASPVGISSGTVRAPSPAGANVRTLSPGVSQTRLQEGTGFNWSSAAPPVAPVSPRTAGAVNRISSPGLSNATQPGVTRIASPSGGLKTVTSAAQPFKQGFAWSPEPPSPRTSPRSFSPGPGQITSMAKAVGGSASMGTMSATSSLPRWPM